MCVVSLWISPFDYAVVCSGVKSVAQSDEQKYIFISDTCWTLLRQLCGVNAGFPIDLLLFHNSALPLVSCKVTGCVSQRSQGHCGFVCVSVCVCACVCVFVSHMDHMLVSSLEGITEFCQNKSCYLCCPTHRMWKGHRAAVPGGAAERPCVVHRLTLCPTFTKQTNATEYISEVCVRDANVL